MEREMKLWNSGRNSMEMTDFLLQKETIKKKTEGEEVSEGAKKIRLSRVKTKDLRGIITERKSEKLEIESVKQEIDELRKEKKKLPNRFEDLTYILATSALPIGVLILFQFLQILVRYYTLGCLVFMLIESNGQCWEWIFSILICWILYVTAIVKISLKQPETRSEFLLKTSFNSLDNDFDEYFSLLSRRKLICSLLRGMLPSELSFFYICGTPKLRLQVYTMVNFIYASIEAMLYLPFFITYTIILTEDNTFGFAYYNPNFNSYIAICSLISFISLSIFLIFTSFMKRKKSFFDKK